jgi:Holliday junction resolvase RusA-like endonuclease
MPKCDIDESGCSESFSLVLDSMVSVDEAYFHVPMKTRNGRMTTHAVKSGKLKDFQDNLESILKSVISDSFINKAKSLVKSGHYGIAITVVFSMPSSNYLTSDTTNYIKAYEDCISKATGIDDKYNVIFNASKKLSESDKWIATTELSVVPLDDKYLISKIGQPIGTIDRCSVCGGEIDKSTSICTKCGIKYYS